MTTEIVLFGILICLSIFLVLSIVASATALAINPSVLFPKEGENCPSDQESKDETIEVVPKIKKAKRTKKAKKKATKKASKKKKSS